MNSSTHPLGDMSAEHFLADYWQQQPLLIRQALPDFAAPLTADELAGLACDADIESRIVSGHPQRRAWQLQHGPFDDEDFAALGDSDWTLLVQAVDHVVPAVAALRDQFHFIPNWRLDDVMVSFAAPGGSVGPHFDQYDVFLLQGEGRRHWQIGEHCHADSPLLPNSELSLLQHFDAQQDWILEPGDMLYLPPGVAHWGIALDPCTTFSIGFRAPSHADIISNYCDHILQSMNADQRYSDPGLALQANPGLINKDVAAQLADIVAPLFSHERLLDWFGHYMTQPKYAGDEQLTNWSHQEGAVTPIPPVPLRLDSASRCAYRMEQDQTLLYVDGKLYQPQTAAQMGKATSTDSSQACWRQFVQTLCAQHRIDPDQHATLYRDASVRGTIGQLIASDALIPDI
jgi:50S ribosomal protein L16 3-hydroxylase